jgi:hypothetical protein
MREGLQTTNSWAKAPAPMGKGVNAVDARDLGWDDTHLRGAEHRVDAAGNVASRGFHGDALVTEDDAAPGAN